MAKSDLLTDIAEFTGTPEVKEALKVIADTLGEKPEEDDHGAVFWLLGHTTKGHALVLVQYPE